MDIFDLTTAPAQIAPDYGFMGMFLAIGIGLLLVGGAVLRFTKRGVFEPLDRMRRLAWFAIPFSVIWLGFTSCMGLGEVQSTNTVRAKVLRGEFQTVEGCLDYFHPGSGLPERSIAGDERWSVRGKGFRYGSNQIRFAYHKVEPLGGIVHARSRVEVSYLYDPFLGRDDIVRLKVTQNACPAAPDVSDF